MNNQSTEKFTKEEVYYISPFFTNLDKNIFAAKYLPSEVLGALASRYSRSKKGVRRLFFDEYIKPQDLHLTEIEDSEDFLHCIALTNIRRIEQGVLI